MHLMNLERTLQEGVNRLGTPIFLIYRKGGMYPAGSLATHHEDRWAVLWERDGSRHGQNFATPQEARAYFDARNWAFEYSQLDIIRERQDVALAGFAAGALQYPILQFDVVDDVGDHLIGTLQEVIARLDAGLDPDDAPELSSKKDA